MLFSTDYEWAAKRNPSRMSDMGLDELNLAFRKRLNMHLEACKE